MGAFPLPIGGITKHTSQLFDELFNNGYDVIKLQTNQSRWKIIKKTVHLLFRKNNLIHIHSSENIYYLLLVSLFFRISGLKILISIHAGNFTYVVNSSKVKKKIFSWIIRMVDCIIFMNLQQSNQIIKIFPKFNYKIKYCSPFIFPNFPKKQYISKHDNLSKNIAVMGLWQHLYSFEDVINEISIISKKYPSKLINLKLIVSTALQDTKYKIYIYNIINSIKTKNINIEIIEDLSNPYDLLEKSDLLIRPTEFDSFGLCIAEALYVGTPVIASDVCPRPGKSILYSKKNPQELKSLIDNFIDNGFCELNNNFLIDDSENGFFQIVSIYNMILNK